MAYELVTVLLGGCVGAAVVVYLAFRSRRGHMKSATSAPTVAAPTTAYAPKQERAVEETHITPVVSTPPPAPEPAPEPAAAPAPAMYETVQPAPAPVTYAPPSTTSFGAPTFTKKPTRTYRRRTAPVRSASATKKAPSNKQKKS